MARREVKQKRAIRKFQFLTEQETRFNLSKEAILAHRLQQKSSLLQILDDNSRFYSKAFAAGLVSSPTEFWTKVRISGLNAEEWINRESLSRPVISQVRTVLSKGGATSSEMVAPRIPSKRMEEILGNYLKSENVSIFRSEEELFKAVAISGGDIKKSKQYLAGKEPQKIAWTSFKKDFLDSPFIYLREESLAKQGFKSPDFKTVVLGHEAVEFQLFKEEGKGWFANLLKSGTKKPVAGHVSPAIYGAEAEIAAMLGSEHVRTLVSHRAKELPKVVNALNLLPNTKEKEKALNYIRSLPNTYGRVLKAHGYSSNEISSFVTAIRVATTKDITPSPEIAKLTIGQKGHFSKKSNLTPSGVISKGLSIKDRENRDLIDLAKKNSSQLLENLDLKVSQGRSDLNTVNAILNDRSSRNAAARQAALKEHQIVGSKTIIDHPTKRRIKNAARKTVEKTEAKITQGITEFDFPPSLTEYISEGVKNAKAAEKLSLLHRVTPYAAGVLIGADILASRDKTGPFWGGLMALGVWTLTRKKLPKVTRLLSSGIAYGIGRLGIGSIEGSHSGPLEGFEEQYGFTPAMRKAHSDFGSGWRGISQIPKGLLGTYVEGFHELGEAVIGRIQLTQFGSGWIKKTIDVFGKTLSSLRKTVVQSNAGIQFLKTSPNLSEAKGISNIYEEWLDIYNKSLARGQIELAEQQKLMDQGIWHKLLPEVKREPYIYKGVTEKIHPTMKFSQTDVQEMLQKYAKEKGIPLTEPKSIIEGKPIKIINSPALDSISIAVRKEASIGTLPTLALDPKSISQVKTHSVRPRDILKSSIVPTLSDVGTAQTLVSLPGLSGAKTLTPSDVKLEKYLEKLKGGGLSISQSPIGTAQTLVALPGLPGAKTLTPSDVKLEKYLEKLKGGGLSVSQNDIKNIANLSSVNEFAKTVNLPTPVAHKSVDPLVGTTKEIKSSKGNLIIAGGAVLSFAAVAAAVYSFKSDYSDTVNSRSNGSLRRSHRPKVLESFTKDGITGTDRKKNTEGDFGTGWDPLRRIAKSLFKSATREGLEKLERSGAYKELLRSDEFQLALRSGKPIKELGKGGVGSVELMETTFRGETFRYARKGYTEEVGKATREQIRSGEEVALRTLQDSISPTPYGRGRAVVKGQDVPVLYMEAIEDAVEGQVAIAKQGGLTHKQKSDLIEGVKELHLKGLTHADIKPKNILIDKEGRLVLIDPFPKRYKVSGWDALADDKTLLRLQIAQDQVAVERITSTDGNVKKMISDVNLISNALPYSTFTKEALEQQFRPGIHKAMSPWARKIYKRAKAEHVHKVLRTKYGIPELARPKELRINQRPIGNSSRGSIPEYEIVRVNKRNELHKEALVAAHNNNQSPSRRHRNMSQNNDILAELAKMNEFNKFNK